MDHLDAVLLAIDELVDGGYVKVNLDFIKKEIDNVCSLISSFCKNSFKSMQIEYSKLDFWQLEIFYYNL